MARKVSGKFHFRPKDQGVEADNIKTSKNIGSGCRDEAAYRFISFFNSQFSWL